MVVDATLRVVVVVVVVIVVGDLDFDMRVVDDIDLVVGCACPRVEETVDFVTRGVLAVSLTVLVDRTVAVDFVGASFVSASRFAAPAGYT
jgi:hypothetical protein